MKTDNHIYTETPNLKRHLTSATRHSANQTVLFFLPFQVLTCYFFNEVIIHYRRDNHLRLYYTHKQCHHSCYYHQHHMQ